MTEQTVEQCASHETCAEVSGTYKIVTGSLEGCVGSSNCNGKSDAVGKQEVQESFTRQTWFEGGQSNFMDCGPLDQRWYQYTQSLNPSNFHVWATKYKWFGDLAPSKREVAAAAMKKHAKAYAT